MHFRMFSIFEIWTWIIHMTKNCIFKKKYMSSSLSFLIVLLNKLWYKSNHYQFTFEAHRRVLFWKNILQNFLNFI